jgi:uncharacterized membrane protein
MKLVKFVYYVLACFVVFAILSWFSPQTVEIIKQYFKTAYKYFMQ